MLTKLKSYAIVGVIILFFALISAFGIYYKVASSQIAALTAENSTLSFTVSLNEKTIAQMKLDAERLSNSIVALNKSSRAIEDSFAKEWSAIDQLDALSEERANEEFTLSIERLKAVTAY
ncbi:hypothetical protein [Agrobacterium fabrum]|uniref:hypothetical protein n=1 Tax=Agrobacterium fabrum TaxID=1176649 RepID=UPI000EF488A4|nr:hypothetical protein [Agrobacterium fabrum]AYM57308.1 hypothetical protein At1D132_12910 [Agrobacterium fabrum]NSZ11666.1 hypothetical protein [Agrobacterium fabrum]